MLTYLDQGLHGDGAAGHAGIAGKQEAGHVHELPATEVSDRRGGEGDVQVFDAAIPFVAVEANRDCGVRAVPADGTYFREADDKVRGH